jgi:hypothetical protein
MKKRLAAIQHYIDRILVEKEKMDCEHIRKTARHGCACRRCKAARSINGIQDIRPALEEHAPRHRMERG